MKVHLKEIIEGLEMVNDTDTVYYNLANNKIEVIFEDFLSVPFDDEFEEIIPENVLFLPSRFELDEYLIMKQFVYSIDDEEIYEELSFAINGRGAFRNFKHLIHHYNIQESWYDFKYEAYTIIAKRWCAENNLEYEE